MSTRTHIVLEDGLLERLDEVRGDVPRSKWIQRLIESRLDHPRSAPGRVGEVVLDGPPPLSDEAKASLKPVEELAAAMKEPMVDFKCPVAGCSFAAPSPAAKCSVHGRTVR